MRVGGSATSGSLQMSQQMPVNNDKHKPAKQRLRTSGTIDGKGSLPVPEPRQPVGRPTKYSEELCTEICARIASNQLTKNICKDEHMPVARTAYYWLNKHPEFLHQYEVARDIRASCMLEEIIKIADDCGAHWVETDDPKNPRWVTNAEAVKIAKLQIRERKWQFSRMLPKRSGAKATGNVSTADVAGAKAKPHINVRALHPIARAALREACQRVLAEGNN